MQLILNILLMLFAAVRVRAYFNLLIIAASRGLRGHRCSRLLNDSVTDPASGPARTAYAVHKFNSRAFANLTRDSFCFIEANISRALVLK
jgi:hypothetical protein